MKQLHEQKNLKSHVFMNNAPAFVSYNGGNEW
jgi:hypothetical protein